MAEADLVALTSEDLESAPVAAKGFAKRPLRDVVAEFNTVQRGARAAYERGVVHVLATRNSDALSAALDREVVIDGVDQLTAADAILRVAVGLPRGPGRQFAGIVGTGPMPGPECPSTRTIRLTGRSASVRQVLDEIVQQAPGLVWLATYQGGMQGDGFKVGFMCPGGIYTMMEVEP